MSILSRASRHKLFGGFQDVYQHQSQTLGCTMKLGVYLPPAARERVCPVLYWLSGLTCTEQNFVTKAGAQRAASELGIILVVPDTSPRGAAVADDDSDDLGQGAGFYVNATREPWSQHYRMYDYIVSELPRLIEAEISASDQISIAGHSMGGHGALVIALRNPGRYRAVSALAPIASPMRCPWGQKALTAYLGTDESAWRDYDASQLVPLAKERLPLLIDQGLDDPFLATQLHPEYLERACADHGHPLELRRHPGYDHSYYFIATFIGDHLAHHARALQ